MAIDINIGLWAAAAGTNTITATYSPAIGSLTNGTIVAFRAANTITSTAPTFSPNGLTAKTIVKENSTALETTDIQANGEYWVVYNSSTDKWVLLNPSSYTGYVLQSSCANVNPADSTDYYIGGQFSAAPQTSIGVMLGIPIPKTGTVKAVVVRNIFTAGTNEAVTFNLRLNNTTDTALTSGDFSSSPNVLLTTGLSLAVTQNDYLHLKVTTPNWATNPTGWRAAVTIYIE